LRRSVTHTTSAQPGRAAGRRPAWAHTITPAEVLSQIGSPFALDHRPAVEEELHHAAGTPRKHLEADGGPGQVVVGIKTDRGGWVQALAAAGYQVFPVNPRQVARYRERHGTSGAKSGAGDAHTLADMVRTDRHQLRAAAGDSDQAEAIKLLARAHQTLIWDRQRQVLRLRAALQQFFPAAWRHSATWPPPTPWRCWPPRRTRPARRGFPALRSWPR
jgi:Transposase